MAIPAGAHDDLEPGRLRTRAAASPAARPMPPLVTSTSVRQPALTRRSSSMRREALVLHEAVAAVLEHVVEEDVLVRQRDPEVGAVDRPGDGHDLAHGRAPPTTAGGRRGTSDPRPSCGWSTPASRSPSQIVTWFAVSTGLPAAASSFSRRAHRRRSRCRAAGSRRRRRDRRPRASADDLVLGQPARRRCHPRSRPSRSRAPRCPPPRGTRRRAPPRRPGRSRRPTRAGCPARARPRRTPATCSWPERRPPRPAGAACAARPRGRTRSEPAVHAQRTASRPGRFRAPDRSARTPFAQPSGLAGPSGVLDRVRVVVDGGVDDDDVDLGPQQPTADDVVDLGRVARVQDAEDGHRRQRRRRAPGQAGRSVAQVVGDAVLLRVALEHLDDLGVERDAVGLAVLQVLPLGLAGDHDPREARLRRGRLAGRAGARP